MKKIAFLIMVFSILFLQGCKYTTPVKKPLQSNYFSDQTGDDVYGLFPLPGSDTLLLRRSAIGQLSALTLDAGGALLTANQYSFTYYLNSDLHIFQYDNDQSFGLASTKSYIDLDQQGNPVAQGDWSALLNLTADAKGNYPSGKFLGHSNSSICVANDVSSDVSSQYRVSCLDAAANPEWSLTLPPNTDGKWHGIVGAMDDSGNLYLTATTGDQEQLLAYAPDGTLLWKKPTDTLPGTDVKAMAMVNGKLVVARYDSQDFNHNNYHYLQFSLDGTLESTVNEAGMADQFTIIPYDANSYLVFNMYSGHSIQLSRIDQSGSLDWEKVFAGRTLFLEFNPQETPVKVDSQGNIVMINQATIRVLTPLIFFPMTVTNRYYMTKLNGQGVKIQEDLVGRNRLRIVSDTAPAQTLESGFAPDEFRLTADGYVLAGVNTWDLAEDNPDMSYTPPLVVNTYSW